MKRRSAHGALLKACLIGACVAACGTAVHGSPIVSGDFQFDLSDTQKVSGSGLLDIILFTGNAVPNPAGMPDPNGGMPGGGSTFAGTYTEAGDPETMTVQEVLDFLHATHGPSYNLLTIEIDVNEPPPLNKRMIQIDDFVLTIGDTVLRTAGPVVLDAPDSGSGYSDFIIKGIGHGIDLSQYDPTDTISFYLEASDLDSGFEEFFISADSAHAPEPATMALLGLGLGTLWTTRRKR